VVAPTLTVAPEAKTKVGTSEVVELPLGRVNEIVKAELSTTPVTLGLVKLNDVKDVEALAESVTVA
jgi:hypothetical protein